MKGAATLAGCDKTRGNGFKLERRKFRVDIIMNSEIQTGDNVRHENRLSREVTEAPSLEILSIMLYL